MNIDGRCHCGYIRFNRLLEDGSIDHPADTFCPPLITPLGRVFCVHFTGRQFDNWLAVTTA